MKKLIITLVAVVVLSACGKREEPTVTTAASTPDLKFEVLCLDGIEYWSQRGHSGRVLAVKINPLDRLPNPCLK